MTTDLQVIWQSNPLIIVLHISYYPVSFRLNLISSVHLWTTIFSSTLTLHRLPNPKKTPSSWDWLFESRVTFQLKQPFENGSHEEYGWLLAHLPIISRGDLGPNDFALIALTSVADIMSCHADRCGIPKWTASAGKTTPKDRRGLVQCSIPYTIAFLGCYHLTDV